MKKVNLFRGIANAISYLTIVGQANELFELIQLIVSIIGTLIILAINVWKWWNDAKKDGKIDNEELDQLQNILKDGKNNGKDGRNDSSN